MIQVPRRRRAFAMAIVLMLVVISGVILAFMMDRQGAQSLAVRREMDSYVFHHVSRGIQEAVEAWIRINGNNSIRPALDDDGRAFQLVVDRGQVVNVSFLDAQGTVLADFSGLSGDNLDNAIDILEQLRRNEGRNASQYIRREGPVAISVNAASDQVLQAVIGTILDPGKTRALVSEIRSARSEGLIDREALDGIFVRADVPSANKPKLQGLLQAEPVLWQVIAEAEVNQNVWPPPPTIRYGGLALVMPTSAGGHNRSADLQRSSSMISWENLSDRQ